jgi:hypothetical protein
MGTLLEGSFWAIFSSFPPNAASVRVLGDRVFVSKKNSQGLRITTNELSVAKLNSLPLDILLQRWEWACAGIAITHFMPNHLKGFAPDTYVCVSCRRPDGQTRVGGNVARDCLSEFSALELWAASLAAELMQCRSYLVGTFERRFWAVELQGDETA